jgi:hypothetical protein
MLNAKCVVNFLLEFGKGYLPVVGHPVIHVLFLVRHLLPSHHVDLSFWAKRKIPGDFWIDLHGNNFEMFRFAQHDRSLKGELLLRAG